ncbi:hypothetical protein DFH09DRAFT_1287811, partial [Mycena vulgaris]
MLAPFTRSRDGKPLYWVWIRKAYEVGDSGVGSPRSQSPSCVPAQRLLVLRADTGALLLVLGREDRGDLGYSAMCGKGNCISGAVSARAVHIAAAVKSPLRICRVEAERGSSAGEESILNWDHLLHEWTKCERQAASRYIDKSLASLLGEAHQIYAGTTLAVTEVAGLVQLPLTLVANAGGCHRVMLQIRVDEGDGKDKGAKTSRIARSNTVFRTFALVTRHHRNESKVDGVGVADAGGSKLSRPTSQGNPTGVNHRIFRRSLWGRSTLKTDSSDYENSSCGTKNVRNPFRGRETTAEVGNSQTEIPVHYDWNSSSESISMDADGRERNTSPSLNSSELWARFKALPLRRTLMQTALTSGSPVTTRQRLPPSRCTLTTTNTDAGSSRFFQKYPRPPAFPDAPCHRPTSTRRVCLRARGAAFSIADATSHDLDHNTSDRPLSPPVLRYAAARFYIFRPRCDPADVGELCILVPLLLEPGELGALPSSTRLIYGDTECEQWDNPTHYRLPSHNSSAALSAISRAQSPVSMQCDYDVTVHAQPRPRRRFPHASAHRRDPTIACSTHGVLGTRPSRNPDLWSPTAIATHPECYGHASPA